MLQARSRLFRHVWIFLSAYSISMLSEGVLQAIVVVIFIVWDMHVPFLTIQKSEPKP